VWRRDREGEHMGENTADVPFFDIGNLSAQDVEAFGASALGHAVRRALAVGIGSPSCQNEDPIAAHESHV
jgi:hypothetical protein